MWLQACFWLLGGSILLLPHLGWETVFLLEALAVPGSSGEEGENKAWVVEGNTRRVECSLAREARVSSLGWFLLACWGLPGSLKTGKGGGPSEGQSAQGRRGGGLHTCLVTSDLGCLWLSKAVGRFQTCGAWTGIPPFPPSRHSSPHRHSRADYTQKKNCLVNIESRVHKELPPGGWGVGRLTLDKNFIHLWPTDMVLNT